MAKRDEISFLEQHVEKGVLALCAILLIYAVVHWYLGSPRKIDGVSPDEIDAKLLKQATATKKRWDGVERRVPEAPLLGQTIDQHRDGPAFGPMVDMSAGRLPIYVQHAAPIEPPTVEELAKLMPPPPKPVTWAGYQAPVKDPENVDPSKLADVGGGRVACLYEWARLQRAWAKKLRPTEIKPALIAKEMRVQVQDGPVDGPWGPQRELVSVKVPLTDEEGNVIELPEVPAYNGENGDEVREALGRLADEKVQRQILRPDYYPIWDGQAPVPWTRNLPREIQQFLQENREGILPVWCHHDGLVTRRKYRYKVQLVLINPLFTQDAAVNPNKPQDARTPTIASPWSPWSDPVSIPKITEFLLTGSNRLRGYVRITVFTQSLGQQLERSFNVWPGQAIGQRVGKTDFSTGAIVVALDFKRPVLRGRRTIETTEMIYLDETGVLRSRTREGDKIKLQKKKRGLAPAPPARGG